MRTMRALRPILFLILAPLAAACPSSSDCGSGTVLRDGTCWPLIGPCFGTLRDDGTCVLPCAAGEAWDPAKEKCVAAAACSPGTADQGGVCLGVCADTEHWDGTACAPGPACGPGTVLDSTGKTCVLAPNACEAGTHLEGDTCVPDASSCGSGTHLEGDHCVSDRLPDPDVSESPSGPAEFTLPAAASSVTLGGNVDAPDAGGNPDWDEFVFTAAAGTWLRLDGTSDGAALPAFMVYSEEKDADGYTLFARYAVNPNGRDCGREVYLPRAGRYRIAVSDYTNVVADLFGYLALPVGGDDYRYQVTVENLGVPTPTALGPFPATATGDAAGGALRFYRLAAVALDDAFDLTSGSPADAANDLFRAVTVFDPAGAPLRERAASSASEEVRTIFAAVTAGDHLVVQDHLVAIGPRRDFELVVAPLVATNCDAVDCSSGALARGARALLRWDLADTYLFVGSVALPSGSPGSLRVVFLDRGLEALAASTSVSAGYNAKYREYAPQATRVHALIMNESSADVPAYTVDARLAPTPPLLLGQLNTGLAVAGTPASTWPPSGFARVTAAAGQVLVSRAFAGMGGTWVTPVEEWLTPGLVTAGPAVDLVTITSPLTRVQPLLAWSPVGGTMLHRAGDSGGDPTGNSYEVAPYALTPNDLGTLGTGATLAATAQTLQAGARVAVLRYAAGAGQGAQVTVTPGGAGLQPDVWILVPGALDSPGGSTWVPSATGLGLAGKARGTAAAAGAAATVAWTSPYAGPCFILVAHAGGGSPTDSFTVTVLQTP